MGGKRNQWNEDDKANLESAKKDYKTIHAQDKKLQADLNNIDYLMYERGRKQAIKLTEQEEGIQSRIAKIDEQLNAYQEKFKLLQAKGDDMTEEERKWLDMVMSSEIVLKLSTQRQALEDSLAKVAALHTELDEAETTITKELGERMPREFNEGSPPILPSYAIAFKMRECKNEILKKVSKVRDIAKKATSLFGRISQSIQKTMASVTKLFASTDRILAKSQSLLNKSPEPSHQMDRNTAPR